MIYILYYSHATMPEGVRLGARASACDRSAQIELKRFGSTSPTSVPMKD